MLRDVVYIGVPFFYLLLIIIFMSFIYTCFDTWIIADKFALN